MPIVNNIIAEQLKQIIEKIEGLLEERSIINNDIGLAYQEAKSNGFDVPAIKAIIKLRAKEPAEAEAEELILDTYKLALWMI